MGSLSRVLRRLHVSPPASKRPQPGAPEPRAVASISDRRSFYQLAGDFTPVVLSDIDAIRYCVPTRDAYIGPIVFQSGSFELQYFALALSVLNELQPPAYRSKTFVDIGANIGTTTIPAVVNFGFPKAIAFEPNPFNFQLLRVNLIFNEIEQQVQCFNWAISNSVDRKRMKVNRFNCGDHRLLGDRSSEMSETVEVSTTTLDALVDRGFISVGDLGLVWMDAQGHEGHILAGASKIVASDTPLFTEFCPFLLRESGMLDVFQGIVVQNYSHIVDIRKLAAGRWDGPLPARAIERLAEEYAESEDIYTDLLLVKR